MSHFYTSLLCVAGLLLVFAFAWCRRHRRRTRNQHRLVVDPDTPLKVLYGGRTIPINPGETVYMDGMKIVRKE